jgi:hypothetical protein
MSCIPTKFIIDYGNRVTNIVLEERELQYRKNEDVYQKINLREEDRWILKKDMIQYHLPHYHYKAYKKYDKITKVATKLVQDIGITSDLITIDLSNGYETKIVKYISLLEDSGYWPYSEYVNKEIEKIWNILIENELNFPNYSNPEEIEWIKYCDTEKTPSIVRSKFKKIYGHIHFLTVYNLLECFSLIGCNYFAIYYYLLKYADENYQLEARNSQKRLDTMVNIINLEISLCSRFNCEFLASNMCMLAVYKSIWNTMGAPGYFIENEIIDPDHCAIKGVLKNMVNGETFNKNQIKLCIYNCHIIFRSDYNTMENSGLNDHKKIMSYHISSGMARFAF